MRATGGRAVDTTLGFAGTREEALSIWETAAACWPRVARRPTAGDVAVYRTLSGPKLAARVLILGVTPELRDMVASAGGDPVLVDMSAAMYEATSAMLRRADPARETWIQADWLEADLPTGGFDLILGDQVWWALSVALQHQLRDTIHAALDADGVFVGRARFSEPARAGDDPVEEVAKLVKRLDRPEADRGRIEAELLYWLYDHTADHERRRLNRARTEALLHDLARARQLERHAEFLQGAATRLIGADWTSQPREELIELLSPRFHLIAEERAADYESSQHPVLAMAPR